MRGVTSSIHPSVLLVYPPYEHPPVRCGRYYTSMPLGTAYMASMLEENGVSVGVLDCNIGDLDVSEAADVILEQTPSILGFTVSSPSIRYVYKLIQEVGGRGVDSGITVACGGPHVTADPASSKLLGADVLFTGESEYCFADYCVNVIKGRSVNQDIIRCGVVEDLNSLPNPARHRFTGRYRFTPVLASRGCPFTCAYCSLCGTGYRMRSLENVEGEIRELVEEEHPADIDFTDDVFTLDREYARGLADIMNQYSLSWACTTRADLVDSTLIQYFADMGCRHISFGVESGVEEIRYRVGKKVPDGGIRKAFNACRDAGVDTRAYAMLGLPGETEDDMDATVEFIDSLGPDEALYFPTTVYPGSPLMDTAVTEGRVSPSAWVEYMLGRAGIPHYVPDGFTEEEIITRCSDEMMRFHRKPGRILRRLAGARNPGDLSNTMKDAAYHILEPFLREPS